MGWFNLFSKKPKKVEPLPSVVMPSTTRNVKVMRKPSPAVPSSQATETPAPRYESYDPTGSILTGIVVNEMMNNSTPPVDSSPDTTSSYSPPETSSSVDTSSSSSYDSGSSSSSDSSSSSFDSGSSSSNDSGGGGGW